METLKEFFNSPIGKKTEKYMWEVAVLSLTFLGTILVDISPAYALFLSPILTQITKYINVTYLKK